jgi:hypothetical protein
VINPLWDGDYVNIEKTEVTCIHTRKPRTRRDKSLGEFRAFIILFILILKYGLKMAEQFKANLMH